MAVYPGADWRPIGVNFSAGGQARTIVVAHIMEGTLAGTDSWFRNPASGASAHFGVGKTGVVYQWVDTASTAWHCAAGNAYTIGIEHEGFTGEALTPAQVSASAGILAWAHGVHPVPLQTTNSPTAPGLGWHGMGGPSWGNHPDCPGPPIVGQLPQIVAQAQGSLPQPEPDLEDDMPSQPLVFAPATATSAATAMLGWGNQWTDGKGRLVFVCNEPCQIRINALGALPAVMTLNLGASMGRQGVEIPQGCRCMLVLRDSGTEPICWALSH